MEKYVFALVIEDAFDGAYYEGDIVFVTGYCNKDIMGDWVTKPSFDLAYVESGMYRIISDEEAEDRGANVQMFRKIYPNPKKVNLE